MAYDTKKIRECAADTTGELTESELSNVNGGKYCEEGAADRAIGVWCNLMGQLGFGYAGLSKT
jgi:bacteriocin-like protein